MAESGTVLDIGFSSRGGPFPLAGQDLMGLLKAAGAIVWPSTADRMTFGSSSDIVSTKPLDAETPILQGATSARRPTQGFVDGDSVFNFAGTPSQSFGAVSYAPNLNQSHSWVIPYFKMAYQGGLAQALIGSQESSSFRSIVISLGDGIMKFIMGPLPTASVPFQYETPSWMIASFDASDLSLKIMVNGQLGTSATAGANTGSSTPALTVGATSTANNSSNFYGPMADPTFWPGIALLSPANADKLALQREVISGIFGL